MPDKITKRTVDQLLAGIVWDGEIKGFGVRCRASGGKYYVLKTRVGGRQCWITIGRPGSPGTPDPARRGAVRVVGLKGGGKGPGSDRDRQKGAVTIAELGDRFLQEYVPQHCKRRTAEEYQRALERHISPILGLHRIADLTRADIAQF